MYNSHEIAARIKLRANKRGIALNEMLKFCGLGINTISKMSKGTDILAKNIAKIADYLDCSVDYLLGRTDDINANENEESLLKNYRQLNSKGQEQAFNYTKNLSQIDEYKKCDNIESENVG